MEHLPDSLAESLLTDSSNGMQLPFAFAKRFGVLQSGREGDALCRTDVRLQSLLELRRQTGKPLRFTRIETADFDQRLQQVYEAGTAQTMNEGWDEELDLFSVAQQLAEPEDLLESQDDAPIIRLINALLTQAIKERASDIHLEPYENRLVVRFRVDGVMREVLAPKRALAPLLVSRIKIMAKLDIAEKRLPQDGRISLRLGGRAVDVRVSTMPTGHGERVVLRLLDKQAGRLGLSQLGMNHAAQQGIDRIIHRPHGILLVTGPTGSGKSTTLYAALTRINDRSRNIMTVEDPIEYHIDGISQTNVNLKVEMSFARGLRAILRQDPDVVMVGEIRDLETAEIAVQASLTGHLVMSTLHTNSAVGAVTRLRDMGVEPFLLSSSLLGVLAQRLVRMLCPQCKQGYTASETDCAVLGLSPAQPPMLYQAVGCEHCGQRGNVGRAGIYELIEVDETLRQMIHDGAGEHALNEYARSRSESIFQDGVRRVLAGDIALAELLRVTRED